MKLDSDTGVEEAKVSQRPVWVGYITAIFAVLVITAALQLVDPILPLGRFPVWYFLAVGLVAYLFGEGPAILAFILSLLSFVYFFVSPEGRLWPIADSPTGWASWIAFVLGTILVGTGMGRIRSLQHRTRNALRRAEHEIAERARAEVALRESEDRLKKERAILDAVADNTEAHLAYLDRDFSFVWVNRTYADACGRAREDFAGHNHFDLFPHEENEAIFHKVRDTGQAIEFKAKPFAHPDQPERGITYWYWTLTPVKDESGEVRGLVLSLTDVTDLKQSEERLREALEREEHVSRLLQRALLPETPTAGPGYGVAYAYIPAFATREIGGDFYDVFRTEDGKIGILIGDVTGKGVEAASLAAATRSTVRAFAYDTSDPGESLTHANGVLIAEGRQAEKFVTLLLVVLDPRTGHILCSSAGHPPAALYHADGRVEFLKGGNVPMGVLSGQIFESGQAQLASSETLILYTDGITEARRGPDMFGEEGIVKTLAGIDDRSPQNVVDSLVEAAAEWAEGHLRDDTAILAVQRE